MQAPVSNTRSLESEHKLFYDATARQNKAPHTAHATSGAVYKDYIVTACYSLQKLGPVLSLPAWALPRDVR